MRKTFALTVFYFYLSAAAVLIEVSGVAAAWGVESPTGVTAAIDKVTAELSNITTGTGLFETLISVFVAATRTMEVVGSAVFALPRFLTSAGVPGPFVAFLFAPAVVIVGRDILHTLSGRFQ